MNTRFISVLWVLVIGIFIIYSSASVQAERNKFTEEEKKILKETKVIRLVVKASTWRENVKPYDIEKIVTKKLEKAGFIVVDEKTKNYDATLFIDYNEKMGSTFRAGEKEGRSTNISCDMKFTHNKIGSIFEDSITPLPFGFYRSIFIATDSEATPVLYDMANDYFEKNPIYKYIDKIIIAEISMESRLPVIIPALTPDDQYAIVQAAEILGDLGDKKAVDPLMSALKPDVDSDNDSRRAIQKALKELGWNPQNDIEIVYYYIGTYHLSDKDTFSITSMGSKAIDPLLAIMNNPMNNWLCRSNAARALGDMKVKDAADALILALKSKDVRLRLEAARALGEIGDTMATKSLLHVYQSDSDSDVRQAAKEALVKIQKDIQR